MATSLAGLTALVTGATSGIGREVALQLAEHGADVVVHGRSAERGAKTVRDIQNAGGKHVSSPLSYVNGAVLHATGGQRAIAA
ncbi:MAG: SDR family NAD(P)-dependent oxidoreductase [Mycobacterium sp.]|uniref:SDR family NAD(P)-dependent oxidoreductase n=1 Tax=Mycobacterium sp. TaxID=1785 RepID=UPI003C519045